MILLFKNGMNHVVLFWSQVFFRIVFSTMFGDSNTQKRKKSDPVGGERSVLFLRGDSGFGDHSFTYLPFGLLADLLSSRNFRTVMDDIMKERYELIQ